MKIWRSGNIFAVLLSFLLFMIILLPLSQGNIQSEEVEFEVLAARSYSIALTSGVQPDRTKNWSLISLPFALINESVDSFTSSVAGNWTRLFTYDASGPYLATPSGGSLEKVYFTSSYWIKMDNSDTLTFEGINYEDSLKARSIDIPLTVGWNIIGYPYNYSRNVTEVLSGIDGKWDILAKFHNPPYGENNKTWVEIGADQPQIFWQLNNFTQFNPGYGYEIHVNQSSTLTYTF